MLFVISAVWSRNAEQDIAALAEVLLLKVELHQINQTKISQSIVLSELSLSTQPRALKHNHTAPRSLVSIPNYSQINHSQYNFISYSEISGS